MPKTSNKSKSDDSDLPFEKALGQLEELVRDMESDQLPLEELIQKYELGTKLYSTCEKRLDEAQGRIEMIRKNRSGEAVVEDFDSTAENPTATKPADVEDNGELF